VKKSWAVFESNIESKYGPDTWTRHGPGGGLEVSDQGWTLKFLSRKQRQDVSTPEQAKPILRSEVQDARTSDPSPSFIFSLRQST